MSDLVTFLQEETAAAAPEGVKAFAAHLSRLPAAPPLSFVFYGSNLRSGDLDGILDFYVLVERMTDWRRGISSFFDTRLPPRVEYHEWVHEGRLLRAKVSIIPAARFAELSAPRSMDTTIWARFCQPVSIVFARDEATRRQTIALIADAVATAARWAALLGPQKEVAHHYWRNLFRHTYSAELRVEQGRANNLMAGLEDRFATLLPLAWSHQGIDHAMDGDGRIAPHLDHAEKEHAKGAWKLRRQLGKPLNLARLCKAAFSFSGGARYMAWKIERHTGMDIALTPWQERHPLLAAPGILWRLWRKGVFRQRGEAGR